MVTAAEACGICLEPPALGARSTTPCGHSFCSDCVLQWLEQRPSCPLCKAAVATLFVRRRLDGTLLGERQAQVAEPVVLLLRARWRRIAIAHEPASPPGQLGEADAWDDGDMEDEAIYRKARGSRGGRLCEQERGLALHCSSGKGSAKMQRSPAPSPKPFRPPRNQPAGAGGGAAAVVGGGGSGSARKDKKARQREKAASKARAKLDAIAMRERSAAS